MPVRSELLASMDKAGRRDLIRRLHQRQGGKCFICDDSIDLELQADAIDVDHIDPLSEQGRDDENNFAVTHAPCNRSKGASDLRVARRMAEFARLQEAAQQAGKRGANLGDVLAHHGGASARLRLKKLNEHVEYVLSEADDSRIRRTPIWRDPLSEFEYFFAVLPLACLHHDDRINPRSIGSNVRGLIEEFMKKRPQLHVALGWWAPEGDGAGPVKVFDGQHKAAAQILLGVKELPVRVFVQPDLNVLLQANTHAGDTLRQVAFDTAVMRYLGSTLYQERVRQFQELKHLAPDDFSFTEQDLVSFFKGEHREMEKYIIDAQRAAVTTSKDNRLIEFVEWSGKGFERPLAYTAVERTFFKWFLYKKALPSSIGSGFDTGENPRLVERDQLVRLMSLFAEVFFVGSWEPELGGRQLEHRLRSGDPIQENHLRAWRIAREEVLDNVLEWTRLVIQNYFAFTGQMVQLDRVLHRRLPDELWHRIEAFLCSLARLPCWIDKNLSSVVFGAKQNRDFWEGIFRSGSAPSGVRVLAKPLDLKEMIVDPAQTGPAS
jgi:hypothetical protein